jgi:ATP-dependent Clp protease ATP-binding subunit ClpB
MQFEIERQALSKETDTASKERLKKIEHDLANLREESSQLSARWNMEKAAISDLREIKEKIENTNLEIEKAERVSDLEKAARLRYGTLRELSEKRSTAEEKLKQLQGVSALLKEEVDAEEIAGVVSRWSGIPVTRLMEAEMQRLVHMEEELHKRVIGQNDAINTVSNTVRRARAGLQDPNRPIGSFIFLGPTGVGKTELARALAEFLFNDERSMIRIDMSEYQERHTVSRLVGAPPGYIGYDEGGQLTEAVRRRPYSVVLFDEIEKAHPEVFNVLLQLLDDGRLTDGHGRTVDFKNTVVIMTSNLGGGIWYQEDNISMEKIHEILQNHFRPEFLNRIDEIITFHRLTRDDLKQIIKIQLGILTERLKDRGLTITLQPEVLEYLAEVGYDPDFGARPLKRSIQREIMDPLAIKLLTSEIKDGQEVVVSKDSNNLVFEAK